MMFNQPLKRQLILLLSSSQALFAGLVVAFNREYLVLTSALICLSVSVGVIRTFFPIVRAAALSDMVDETDVVGIAAVLKSLALTILAGWIVGGKILYGEIPPVKESAVLVYVLFMSAVGGIFYMASEGAIRGVVPKEEWIRAGVWAGVGVLLSGGLLLWTSYLLR